MADVIPIKPAPPKPGEPAWAPEMLWEWCKRIRELPAPKFILDPLIPYDGAVMVSGRPKATKKSYFVRMLALHVAAGKKFGPWEQPLKSGVLFIDKEGPSKLSELRWTVLETSTRILRKDLDNFYYTHRDPIMLDDDKWSMRVCNFVKERDIKLVIMDTFNKVHKCDENDSQEMTRVSAAMDKIRNAGASVLYIQHLRKETSRIVIPEDIDKDVRGSTVMAGHYDVHIGFRTTKTQNLLTGYVCGKHHAGEAYRFYWDIDEDNLKANVSIDKIEEAKKNTGDANVKNSGLARARAAKRKEKAA